MKVAGVEKRKEIVDIQKQIENCESKTKSSLDELSGTLNEMEIELKELTSIEADLR